MAQTERQIEAKAIKLLEAIGYKFIHFKDYQDFINNFRKNMNKLNKLVLNNIELTDSEFERFFNIVASKNVYQAAALLRDKVLLERDDGTQVYIILYSDDSSKNTYQVTNQFTMKGTYKNRYDVIVLVNGLPLVPIELKRPGVPIYEARNQINRYKLHSYSGLFNYIQAFIISNLTETKYCANCMVGLMKTIKILTIYILLLKIF